MLTSAPADSPFGSPSPLGHAAAAAAAAAHAAAVPPIAQMQVSTLHDLHDLHEKNAVVYKADHDSWEASVLELGAADRNAFCQKHNLSDLATSNLKKASRKHKQRKASLLHKQNVAKSKRESKNRIDGASADAEGSDGGDGGDGGDGVDGDGKDQPKRKKRKMEKKEKRKKKKAKA